MLRRHEAARRRVPSRRRFILRRVMAGSLVIVIAVSAWILVPALTAPGNDTFSARLAESARDHGFSFVVTALERLQYQLDPPAVGGTLDPATARSLAVGAGATPPSHPRPSATRTHDPVVLHAPLATLATPALPGEGVFRPVVTVRGEPAVQVALLRPDSQHTSYLAGVAWMSGRLLSFVQHPGAIEPGQLSRWSQPATVPPSARAGLAATFNSGFKLADSHGGYYADGHTAQALRAGGASLVIYSDGHVDIGSWGSEVTMTPRVRSVRQNLDLLIDGGRLAASAQADNYSSWGATIGAAAYVWRSGVGVTALGDVVYVGGPAMSAKTLAVLLQRAGAVRAMELDINPDWVSYMWYSGSSAGVLPHKLVQFSRPVNRYYQVNSRDFFAVYAR